MRAHHKTIPLRLSLPTAKKRKENLLHVLSVRLNTGRSKWSLGSVQLGIDQIQRQSDC